MFHVRKLAVIGAVEREILMGRFSRTTLEASIAQLLGSFRLTCPKHYHLSMRKSSNQKSPNFEERFFAHFRNNNL
ncbi:hypothetical protein T05_11723, partial [Trichinella murrelli]